MPEEKIPTRLELIDKLAIFISDSLSSSPLATFSYNDLLRDESEDLDDTADAISLTMAEQIIDFLFGGQVIEGTPEIRLPKAKYKLEFKIVDEMCAKHVCTLTLHRSLEMTDGDFMQLQNFFWTTIGRAIVRDPNIVSALRLAGIDVDTDPGNGSTSLPL